MKTNAETRLEFFQVWVDIIQEEYPNHKYRDWTAKMFNKKFKNSAIRQHDDVHYLDHYSTDYLVRRVVPVSWNIDGDFNVGICR